MTDDMNDGSAFDELADGEMDDLFSAFSGMSASDDLKAKTLAAIAALPTGAAAASGAGGAANASGPQPSGPNVSATAGGKAVAKIGRSPFRAARIAAIAACMSAAVVGGVAYAMPTSHVMLTQGDSSIELSVNRFGMVVSAASDDDAGRAIIDSNTFVNLSYEDALVRAADAMGASAPGSTLQLSVESGDASQRARLEDGNETFLASRNQADGFPSEEGGPVSPETQPGVEQGEEGALEADRGDNAPDATPFPGAEPVQAGYSPWQEAPTESWQSEKGGSESGSDGQTRKNPGGSDSKGSGDGGKSSGGKSNGGKSDGGKTDGGKSDGGKTDGGKTDVDKPGEREDPLYWLVFDDAPEEEAHPDDVSNWPGTDEEDDEGELETIAYPDFADDADVSDDAKTEDEDKGEGEGKDEDEDDSDPWWVPPSDPNSWWNAGGSTEKPDSDNSSTGSSSSSSKPSSGKGSTV